MWVGWCLECEENYPWLKEQVVKELFDVWMTYHPDADVVLPYYDADYAQRLLVSPEKKSADVCMFVSNPANHSQRKDFERIVSLTQKIQALNLNYRAGMITNGYLFTENIASQLTDLNIRKVQITIDGNERTHDSRRCLRSGKGTFKKIVDNVEMLQRIAPEVRVNLRVNIDATNQDDFIELHRFFTDKHYPNLVVSPAFVTDLSGCNVDDCIFDTERKLQFIFKMKQEHGLNCIPFYPLSHRYECTVRNANTVVIGPEGELYKCWNDVGNKDAVIGNVDGKITNETLLLRYLTGADPFEDPKCRECLLHCRFVVAAVHTHV